jgi:hypothetical protein
VKTITPKTRYKIEQVRVDDWQGVEKWNLDRFAREFGHQIAPVFPIFLVFIDGTLSAYYYAQPQVCIYPAVHPELICPRSLYEVGKVVVAASKQVFGNPLWLIEEGSPGEQPEMLKKLRLGRTALRVYEVEE